MNLTPTLLIAFRTDFIFRPPSPPFQLQSSPRVIYCKTICDRLAAGGVSFEITMLARRPSTRRNIFQQQYHSGAFGAFRSLRAFPAKYGALTACADIHVFCVKAAIELNCIIPNWANRVLIDTRLFARYAESIHDKKEH